MPMFDFRCSSCGTEWEELTNSPNHVTCCGRRATKIWKKQPAVIQDSIIGGVWVENLGHEPVFIESKQQLLREAKARGLEPFVRHTTLPGTDKSKHTSNWASVSKESLAGAKSLLETHSRRNSGIEDAGPEMKVEVRERTKGEAFPSHYSSGKLVEGPSS
jgi:hypothetical protein